MREKSPRFSDPLFLLFGITAGLFVFFSAFYRAATTGITVDEAYTYLWYVWNFNLKSLPAMFFESYANNHWLNTALIALTQQVTHKQFDELTIRLPSLLFYAGFLALTFAIAKDKPERFLIFALLTFNYYLHEFFGLGRGYGMSAALTLAGLYFLDLRHPSQPGAERRAMLVLAFLTLSVYANGVALLILAATGLTIFVSIFRTGNLKAFLAPKYLAALLLLGVANLLMVFYYFNITETGKPIPMYTEQMSFYKAVAVGYIKMYIASNNTAANITGAILTAFFILTLIAWRKKIIDRHFIQVFIIHLVLVFITANISHKAYPSERVLLPSVPLFVLALADCAALWRAWLEVQFPRANQSPYQMTASLAVILLLAALFLRKYDLTATQEWRDNYKTRDVTYATLALHKKTDPSVFEPWTAQLQFYTLKIKKTYGVDIRDYP
jgi:hypothetical protein